MTDLQILDGPVVNLVRSSGGDESIVQAARVSVIGENFAAEDLSTRDAGLINYLIREKHGSPFEHNSMTFYVKAPIFVFREFHRHRIGFSYNEMSGRYTKLEPEFYIPNANRPLVNVGTASKPEFAAGDESQYEFMHDAVLDVYEHAWSAYNDMLDAGIANEVARIVLPVGIYSQMYVTCNARSLMSFLTLRTKDERAAHLSRPQQEIEMVARQLEAYFSVLFPETYERYNEHKRVAP